MSQQKISTIITGRVHLKKEDAELFANILNVKVDTPACEEGPGYGAAILAATGCGVFPTVEAAAQQLVQVKATVEPEPELVKKYEKQYQKFRMLYPALQTWFTL